METRINNIPKITIEELILKHPKIFVKTRDDKIQWEGLPVPWMNVVNQLCTTIQYFIDNKTHTIVNINYIGDSVFDVTNTNTHKYIKTSIPQIICTRLKERDGVLKFYTNIEIPIIQGMIFFAEQLCYNMCEFCGCTEELGETDGWKKICCKNCCKEDVTWKKRY
jgi:hypothetical protein